MMRINNRPLLTAGDVSGNLASSPLLLAYAFGFAIQATYAGAPVGTLILQGSNDASQNADATNSGFQPTNWTDISSTSTSVSAPGSTLFNIQGAYYTYVRAVWTAGAGTGTLTVSGNVKGT